MIGVRHGDDAGTLAGENASQRLVDLRELLLQLIEQVLVVVSQSCARSIEARRSFNGAGDVENKPLAAQTAVFHCRPVARETLVASTPRPRIRRALGLFVKAKQLLLVVRI